MSGGVAGEVVRLGRGAVGEGEIEGSGVVRDTGLDCLAQRAAEAARCDVGVVVVGGEVRVEVAASDVEGGVGGLRVGREGHAAEPDGLHVPPGSKDLGAPVEADAVADMRVPGVYEARFGEHKCQRKNERATRGKTILHGCDWMVGPDGVVDYSPVRVAGGHVTH